MMTQAELKRIISSYSWNCTLVHGDGTSESFQGFLAEWGRPRMIIWDRYAAPVGTNRYVILAESSAPKATQNERLEVEHGSTRKVLRVLQCHILDWKIEYVCEELT